MFKKYTLFLLAFLFFSSLNSHAARFVPGSNNDSDNQLPPLANDDFASVIVGLQSTTQGNLTANDTNGQVVTLAGSATGKYGYLNIQSDGTYEYTLFDNATNSALASNETVTDVFVYSYLSNLNGSTLSDTAKLIVQVSGNQQAFSAIDFNTSVVVNKLVEVAGDVTSDDTQGGTIVLSSSPVSVYGLMALNPNGEFTYTLNKDSVEVINLKAGDVVTDTFEYLYSNNFGQSTTASINIKIFGADLPPATSIKANNDNVVVVVNKTPEVTGNVITNDEGGESVELTGSPVSNYGYIVLNADGTFTYTVDEKATEIVNLQLSDVVTDTYSYIYTNKETGQSDTAQIIVRIYGNPQEEEKPSILEDSLTFVVNDIIPEDGKQIVKKSSNVINNAPVQITSSPVSKYGYMELLSDGSYTYTLYRFSYDVLNLKAGDVVIDSFDYEYLDELGKIQNSKINVRIIGNPIGSDGDIVPGINGISYFNVDIEFNDRAAQATPLNSGRHLKGHLHNSGDKDWYSLASAGDEVITLELCPRGSTCYDKGSWVMYVFDSDKLTEEIEEREYTLYQTTYEENGGIYSRYVKGTGNHMYGAYSQGFFRDALIGVIDPCFDTNNSVSIGVGEKPRNYLIAVSSPLRGGMLDNEGVNIPYTDTDGGKCGVGSNILEYKREYEAEIPVIVTETDADGNVTTKTESKKIKRTIISEYTAVFPYSDDQYLIKVTGTGIHPLLSTEAAGKSSIFDSKSGLLSIPKVRVLDEFYKADLSLKTSVARSTSDDQLKFDLSNLGSLGLDEVTDAFQATYNPENNEVLIPRVTDSASGKAYSVTMKYHAPTGNDKSWLEVIDLKLIQ